MQNVRDFGAIGDGVTKDTAAIQRAIDAGGIVNFPPGTYLSGTLYLKSNGGIHLEAGATLLASPDKEDYNADDFCPQNRAFKKECVSGAHFITAVEQHHVSITGSGKIDGNRAAFYATAAEMEQIWSMNIEWRPGQMIFLCECDHVRVEDVELLNAPYWTCFLHGCEEVHIRGLQIYNHPFTRNGDGIDIDCCRFVTVSDCIIDSGDDCITLRGYVEPLKKKRACEYITITNCILRTICNAFRIGVGNGIVRNAVISNCVIHDSRNGILLCSKYSEQNGVLIEDIQFENIRVEATLPIAVLTNAWGRRLGPAKQPIRNVSFHHIRGTGQVSCRVVGQAPEDIENVTFSDVELDWIPSCPPAAAPDDCCEDTRNSPPAPFYWENVKGARMENCAVRWKTDDPGWAYGAWFRKCSETETFRCRLGKDVMED